MIDEQYTDGSHNCMTPTFTLRPVLVIQPMLAGLQRQHWENMCGRFGLPAPFCSVKTLDLRDDPEKQLSVYSNLLNCFSLVCRWQAIQLSFQNIEQIVLKLIHLLVLAQRWWKGVIIQLSPNLVHLSLQTRTKLLGYASRPIFPKC